MLLRGLGAFRAAEAVITPAVKFQGWINLTAENRLVVSAHACNAEEPPWRLAPPYVCGAFHLAAEFRLARP